MNLLLPTIEPRLPKRAPKNLVLGWRLCQPDLRSTHGYRWPLPGEWAESEGPHTHGGPCPDTPGDGICVARTWSGATSGGCRSQTALLVAYKPSDVLGEDSAKVRVKRALVLDIFSTLDTLGPRANLSGADLSRANLSGANLSGADLFRADLSGANLSRAYVGDSLTIAEKIRPLGWVVAGGYVDREK